MTKSVDVSPSDTHEGRLVLPSWLDGRTIALLTTIVTAALTLGTMMQAGQSHLANRIDEVRRDLRSDIDKVRVVLSSDIDGLDDRLRSVEIDVAAIRAAMTGLDARLSAVEEHARHPSGSPRPG